LKYNIDVIRKIEVNLNIVPANTYRQVFKKSKSEITITQSPIIKDITCAEESFSLS